MFDKGLLLEKKDEFYRKGICFLFLILFILNMINRAIFCIFHCYIKHCLEHICNIFCRLNSILSIRTLEVSIIFVQLLVFNFWHQKKEVVGDVEGRDERLQWQQVRENRIIPLHLDMNRRMHCCHQNFIDRDRITPPFK